MKTIAFFLLFLLAGLVRSQSFYHLSEKDFEIEFGKHSKDQNEEKRDEQALIKSEQQINDQNEKFLEGEVSYYEKLTENSDLTKEELEARREGAILPENVKRGLGAILPPENEWYTHPELQSLHKTVDRQTIPTSYNATSINLVTSIKNQGQCGSCANFAATSMHETSMLKSGVKYAGLDLSEQQLLDCAYGSRYINGCNGADSGAYGTYFVSKMGGQAAHEFTYPYKGSQSKYVCPTGLKTFKSGAKVHQTLADYSCTEDKLTTMVATYGAAVSYLYASDSGFDNYAGGIFNDCSSTSINHAITVTGYGTDSTYGNYWIIKNSWGPNWGLQGYMKIKRGANMCGIGSFCYTAKAVKTTGSISAVPTLPVQTTCDFTKLYGTLNGNYYFPTTYPKLVVSCTNGMCKPASGTFVNACYSICGLLDCSALG